MIHGIKKNMHNKLLTLHEKIMLKKRSIIETLFDYLKNKMNLVHSRYRWLSNALVHIISTLVAHSLKKSKPKINYYTKNHNLHRAA